MTGCAHEHLVQHLKQRLLEHGGGEGDLGLQTDELFLELVDGVLLVLQDLVLDADRVFEPVCVSHPPAPGGTRVVSPPAHAFAPTNMRVLLRARTGTRMHARTHARTHARSHPRSGTQTQQQADSQKEDR